VAYKGYTHFSTDQSVSVGYNMANRRYYTEDEKNVFGSRDTSLVFFEVTERQHEEIDCLLRAGMETNPLEVLPQLI
jgi:hypothetical protein